MLHISSMTALYKTDKLLINAQSLASHGYLIQFSQNNSITASLCAKFFSMDPHRVALVAASHDTSKPRLLVSSFFRFVCAHNTHCALWRWSLGEKVFANQPLVIRYTACPLSAIDVTS